MILGIGSDLIDIRRIERTLERYGERFIARLFTDRERARAERRPDAPAVLRAATYAKRFAAKEACAKALGTGIARGVFWRDIGVMNQPGGQPGLDLTGGARQRLLAMTPPGYRAVIHVTLTDDYPLAQAFVVISAVAIPAGSSRSGAGGGVW